MNRSVRGVMSVLVAAVLWLPVCGIAGEAPTEVAPLSASQQAKSGSVEKEKNGKKPDQKDVKSRGLFSRKKKKKETGGGAAAHSQSSERTDPSTP